MGLKSHQIKPHFIEAFLKGTWQSPSPLWSFLENCLHSNAHFSPHCFFLGCTCAFNVKVHWVFRGWIGNERTHVRRLVATTRSQLFGIKCQKYWEWIILISPIKSSLVVCHSYKRQKFVFCKTTYSSYLYMHFVLRTKHFLD